VNYAEKKNIFNSQCINFYDLMEIGGVYT